MAAQEHEATVTEVADPDTPIEETAAADVGVDVGDEQVSDAPAPNEVSDEEAGRDPSEALEGGERGSDDEVVEDLPFVAGRDPEPPVGRGPGDVLIGQGPDEPWQQPIYAAQDPPGWVLDPIERPEPLEAVERSLRLEDVGGGLVPVPDLPVSIDTDGLVGVLDEVALSTLSHTDAVAVGAVGGFAFELETLVDVPIVEEVFDEPVQVHVDLDALRFEGGANPQIRARLVRFQADPPQMRIADKPGSSR